MAAADPVKDLKERATCPICLDLFRDPVVTECGHSFCEECITQHCQGDGDVACPQCRKKFQKGNLRPNWELRNMVESLPPLLRSRIVEESRGWNMCDRHQQPLQLYCREDQSPICVFCERSQAHRGHTVVLVEEAVQEYWETLTKHLEGIESTFGSLHPLVSIDRKHLSPSAGEEAHEKLKRLADNVVTLFKVHTEGPRQRSHGAESQTQPGDPEARASSPRKDAGETESQEHKGREPGSEPAAEKQEETGSHVVHVCEEAPTPKDRLDQTTLDPGVHRISDTTEAVQSKVDVKGLVSRCYSPTSPAPSQVSAGKQAGVSPAGQGAAQTESGGDTGRGGRGSQEPNVAAADVHRRASSSPVYPQRSMSQPLSGIQVQLEEPSRLWDSSRVRRPIQQEGAIRLRLLSDGDGRTTSLPALSRVNVKSRIKSLEDLTSVGAGMRRGGSGQVGVSAVPKRWATRGRAEEEGEALEEHEKTETRVHKEAAPSRWAARRNPQGHSTTGGADAPSRGDRFLTPLKPGMGPGGSGQVGVSAVPDRGALRGRAGSEGEAPEEQEATETPVSEEAAPPSPGAGNTPPGSKDSSTGGVDAQQAENRPKDGSSLTPAEGSGGEQNRCHIC